MTYRFFCIFDYSNRLMSIWRFNQLRVVAHYSVGKYRHLISRIQPYGWKPARLELKSYDIRGGFCFYNSFE